MKVVRILGGLGNQMFQYALFLALKKAFPQEEIKVDTSVFLSYKVHNGLELGKIFGVDLPQASLEQLKKLCRYTSNYTFKRIFKKLKLYKKTECFEAKDYTFNETVLTRAGDRIFDGYWQNHHYFENVFDEVRAAYRFPEFTDENNSEMAEKIRQCDNSVSIHVRRGDYLKAPNYAGLCGKDYYKRAIAHILRDRRTPVFFIFSDDMAYCRENLVPLLENHPVHEVDFNRGDQSFRDMQLMTMCQDNIIANSSFSWWAAFLNPHENKIVCAPEKWTNTKINCKIQMPDWQLFPG